MDLRGIMAVVERVINVRAAVIERREQKAKRRGRDGLAGGRAVKGAFLRKIPQRRRRILHGADRADEEAEHLVAQLVLLAVRAAVRHIVGVAREENEVVFALHIERGDDTRIELMPRVLVGARALAQGLQQPVLVAPGDLLRFKRDIDEISPE